MMTEARIATLRRFIIYVWIFGLVLALWPYTSNPVKPIKDLVTAVAALLLGLTIIAWPERSGEAPDWRKMTVLPIIGLWLCWGVVCALFSNHKIAAFDELRIFFGWFIIALFAARLFRTPRHVKMLFFIVCCAVLLANVYGFIQYMGWDPFPWATRDIEEYRGLPSTFGNPNFAGHTMVLAIIMGIGLASFTGMHWFIILILPAVAHLYQTHMRGGPTGLAAALLLFICAWGCARKLGGNAVGKAAAALVITAIVGVVGVSLIMPVSYIRTGFWMPTDGSLILRYNGYYGAAQMILDKPVFGVGPGNYGRENIPYWTPYEMRWFASEQKRNMHVHNDLLETGAEMGVPGLALHVALLVALLVRSLSLAFHPRDEERRRLGYIFAALFTAFAVDGLFGFNLRVPVSGALFFLLAGVLDGISQPAAAVTVAPAPVSKKKRGKEPLPVTTPSSPAPQPRLLFGLGLSVGAAVCVLWASMVFIGENLYQRGQGARIFADTTANPAHRQHALAEAESLITRGRRFVFWDSRYPESLGHIAMRRGDMQGAISNYLQALRREPHHPHTRVNIARAYLSQGLQLARDSDQSDHDNAEAHIEEAYRWGRQGEDYCPPSPYVQDVLWRIIRAKAVLAEQRGEDAEPLWQEVAQRIVESLDEGAHNVQGAYRALAHAYVKTGRAAPALPLFARTLPETPGNTTMWNIFESASRDVGDYQALLQALNQAFAGLLERKPLPEDELVDITRRLTRCHRDYLETPDHMVPLLETALDAAPHRTELWAVAAELHASPDGVRIFCEAVAKYETAPGFIAQACEGPEDLETLAAASQELARASLHASGQLAARDLGGLADLFAVLLEQRPGSRIRQAEVRANIATTYLEAGRWAEAEQNFARAIQELPENTHGRLLAARARALVNLGRRDEGLNVIEDAVRLAPGDPMVQLTRARFMHEIDRIDEAVLAYNIAINALPEQSPVRAQAQRELEALTRRPAVKEMDLEL